MFEHMLRKVVPSLYDNSANYNSKYFFFFFFLYYIYIEIFRKLHQFFYNEQKFNIKMNYLRRSLFNGYIYQNFLIVY